MNIICARVSNENDLWELGHLFILRLVSNRWWDSAYRLVPLGKTPSVTLLARDFISW